MATEARFEQTSLSSAHISWMELFVIKFHNRGFQAPGQNTSKYQFLAFVRSLVTTYSNSTIASNIIGAKSRDFEPWPGNWLCTVCKYSSVSLTSSPRSNTNPSFCCGFTNVWITRIFPCGVYFNIHFTVRLVCSRTSRNWHIPGALDVYLAKSDEALGPHELLAHKLQAQLQCRCDGRVGKAYTLSHQSIHLQFGFTLYRIKFRRHPRILVKNERWQKTEV